MWTRSIKDGKFLVQVWNADNELTFTGEFNSSVAADLAGETENRKALAPLLGSYQMTQADWNDPLLAMSDDKLLAELAS